MPLGDAVWRGCPTDKPAWKHRLTGHAKARAPTLSPCGGCGRFPIGRNPELGPRGRPDGDGGGGGHRGLGRKRQAERPRGSTGMLAAGAAWDRQDHMDSLLISRSTTAAFITLCAPGPGGARGCGARLLREASRRAYPNRLWCWAMLRWDVADAYWRRWRRLGGARCRFRCRWIRWGVRGLRRAEGGKVANDSKQPDRTQVRLL